MTSTAVDDKGIVQFDHNFNCTDLNKLFRRSRPLWLFLKSVAFYHESELTSTAVDDKGIVQFDHNYG